MQYLKGLLKGLGGIIATEKDPPLRRFDPLQEAISADRLLQDAAPPAIMEEVQEEESIYESDDAALKAFTDSYKTYMTNYYGRPPRFRTDLFCAMFPVDIMDPAIDPTHTMRFWWVAITHPVARVLHNHFKSLGVNAAEGTYNSDFYGSCVVYSDDVVEFFVDSMFETYNLNGVELEDVRSDYARRCLEEEAATATAEPPAPLVSDIVYNANGELKIAIPQPPPLMNGFLHPRSAPSLPPPPLVAVVEEKPSLIQEIARRAEGSKKAD